MPAVANSGLKVACMAAADDMDELVHAVKQAIQQCGLQVSLACNLLPVALI